MVDFVGIVSSHLHLKLGWETRGKGYQGRGHKITNFSIDRFDPRLTYQTIILSFVVLVVMIEKIIVTRMIGKLFKSWKGINK